MKKLIIGIALFCILPLQALATDNFDKVRAESVYWKPYRVEGTTTMVVVNKPMSKLTEKENALLCEAIKICKWDRDPTPRKYFWVYTENMEALVSKNYPELNEIKFPADVNDIMINARKQIGTKAKSISKKGRPKMEIYW